MKKKIVAIGGLVVAVTVCAIAYLAWAGWAGLGGPPRPKYSGIYLWEGQGELIPLTSNNQAEKVIRTEHFQTFEGLRGAKIIFSSKNISVIIKGQQNIIFTEMKYSKYEIVNLGGVEKYFVRTECFLPKKRISFLDPRESDKVVLWDEQENIFQLIPAESLQEDTLYTITGTGQEGIWSFQIGSMATYNKVITRPFLYRVLRQPIGYQPTINLSCAIHKEAEELKKICEQANALDIAIYVADEQSLIIQLPMEKKSVLASRVMAVNYPFNIIATSFTMEGPIGDPFYGGGIRVYIEFPVHTAIQEIEDWFKNAQIPIIIIQRILTDTDGINVEGRRFIIWVPASCIKNNNLKNECLLTNFWNIINRTPHTFKIERADFISSKF